MADILSQRMQKKLACNGYVYLYDKNVANGTKKAWRCEQRGNCKGRVYSDRHDNEDSVEIIISHNHGADAAHVEVSRARTIIKERALNTQENPSQITNTVSQSMTVAAKGRFPKQDVVRKVIQRVRNQVTAAPAQPINRASIIIPDNYRNYEYTPGQTETFLIADSGENDANKILIFGRASTASWVGRVRKIYVDGTFSLAPKLFSQLFVIMAEREQFVLPILYILLPNKEQATYERMLEMIVNAWPNLNPIAISMDYELALINSFSSVFPEAEIHGCLFHLTKNIKRKLSEEGLTSRYNNDADFALSARMIASVAFVPIDQIENAIEQLSDELPAELIPVLNYFEDNYLGRLNRNQTRRRPLFDPSIWSVYDRTLAGVARTNNFAEAAHRRLQVEFGVDHPTLWKFIEGIRRVQKSRDLVYEQFIRGEPATKKRDKYVQADSRILTIVLTFNNREILEYLRGLAHNFLMDF